MAGLEILAFAATIVSTAQVNTKPWCDNFHHSKDRSVSAAQLLIDSLREEDKSYFRCAELIEKTKELQLSQGTFEYPGQ